MIRPIDVTTAGYLVNTLGIASDGYIRNGAVEAYRTIVSYVKRTIYNAELKITKHKSTIRMMRPSLSTIRSYFKIRD